MTESDVTSITIKDNINVVVPASPEYMTTFILLEQGDWFEDEIKFLRSYIKPGMKIIDIGSNYGLYTLALAKIISNSGYIWAFEPTEFTSKCLKKSILNNNLKNINLIQSGLSNRVGAAKFYVAINSELNSLSQIDEQNAQYEMVSLLTLDYCKEKYNWDHIDFIKLDAEGEEVNILEQGINTLSSLSPLVMFELKHGNNINVSLITQFNKIGYNCYRLVPGLNVLIPFDHTQPIDDFLLNLFCCKEDKEKLLESGGIIVKNTTTAKVEKESFAYEYIKDLAFGESIIISNSISKNTDKYIEVLNLYIMSLSKSSSSSFRLSCLMESLKGAQKIFEQGEKNIVRLTTFSRIAFDAGECSFGVKILSYLINLYIDNTNFMVNELLLPASPRYDNIEPRGRINEWLLSSILEQYIEKHAYSTYFSEGETSYLFNKLTLWGYMNEDMQRRFQLVKHCYIQ